MDNVKKNIIYNIIYQILIILLPLITAPYVSRIMGVESLGIYSYSYSIVYYFSLFILLGLNNYGNRTIAQVNKNDKKELSKKFCSIYIMQIAIAVIVILIYLLYCFSKLCKYKIVALIQVIYLLGSALDINWFFFGLEKFKITVTRNIFIKVITLFSIFVFVKNVNDLYLYTLIMSISNFISQIFLWFFLVKEIDFEKCNYNMVRQHIKPNLMLFIPVLAVSLYKVMDKIMLGNMSGVSDVAIYENSEKIINVPSTLITAIGIVMLPRISNLLSKGYEETVKNYVNISLKLILWLVFPMMFGIMAVSNKFAILYYGNEFADCGEIIVYLSVTLVFSSIANIIRTQYLIPRSMDRVYIFSVIIGALSNCIANSILIPKFNCIGAVIGTIIAEFLVMLTQILYAHKELEIRKYIKMFFKYCACGYIMYLLILPINHIIKNDLYCVLLQIIMGIFIYMIITIKDVLVWLKMKKN